MWSHGNWNSKNWSVVENSADRSSERKTEKQSRVLSHWLHWWEQLENSGGAVAQWEWGRDARQSEKVEKGPSAVKKGGRWAPGEHPYYSLQLCFSSDSLRFPPLLHKKHTHSDLRLSQGDPKGAAQSILSGSEIKVNILHLSNHLRVPRKAMAHSQEAVWKGFKDEKKNIWQLTSLLTKSLCE